MSNTYATDRYVCANIIGTVNVNTDPIDVGAIVNEFDEQDVAYATPTTIVSYTVPVGKSLLVKGFVGWGVVEAEFLLKVDGTIKAGGRMSTADRTLHISDNTAPIVATAGQVVTVVGEHYYAAVKQLRVNLLGELI